MGVGARGEVGVGTPGILSWEHRDNDGGSDRIKDAALGQGMRVILDS